MELHESPMGCTHSQETQSPLQPSFSPSLPPPAPFKFPLAALAPFHSAPDIAERTRKAKAGWKKKRADMKREWSSGIEKDKNDEILEVYQLNRGCAGKRVVGASMPTRIGAPTMTEQTSEDQYPGDTLSASDDGVDEGKSYYAGNICSGSDYGADEALQASRMRSDS